METMDSQDIGKNAEDDFSSILEASQNSSQMICQESEPPIGASEANIDWDVHVPVGTKSEPPFGESEIKVDWDMPESTTYPIVDLKTETPCGDFETEKYSDVPSGQVPSVMFIEDEAEKDLSAVEDKTHIELDISARPSAHSDVSDIIDSMSSVDKANKKAGRASIPVPSSWFETAKEDHTKDYCANVDIKAPPSGFTTDYFTVDIKKPIDSFGTEEMPSHSQDSNQDTGLKMNKIVQLNVSTSNAIGTFDAEVTQNVVSSSDAIGSFGMEKTQSVSDNSNSSVTIEIIKAEIDKEISTSVDSYGTEMTPSHSKGSDQSARIDTTKEEPNFEISPNVDSFGTEISPSHSKGSNPSTRIEITKIEPNIEIGPVDSVSVTSVRTEILPSHWKHSLRNSSIKIIKVDRVEETESLSDANDEDLDQNSDLSSLQADENENEDECEDFEVTLAESDDDDEAQSADEDSSVKLVKEEAKSGFHDMDAKTFGSPVKMDENDTPAQQGWKAWELTKAFTSEQRAKLASNSDGTVLVSLSSRSKLSKIKTRPIPAGMGFCFTIKQIDEILDMLPNSDDCKICEKKFTKSFDLDEHEFSEHGVKKVYDCDVCPYWTECLEDLQRHILVHKVILESPYPDESYARCTDCLDVFVLSEDLIAHTCHVYQHAVSVKIPKKGVEIVPPRGDEKTVDVVLATSCPLTCVVCAKEFDTLFSRDFHYKSEHKMDKVYGCNKCSYRGDWYREIDRHQRVHQIIGTEALNFQCKVCHDMFTHKDIFKRHLNLAHAKITLPHSALSVSKGKDIAPPSGSKSNQNPSTAESPRRKYTCAVKGCRAVFQITMNLDKHYVNKHNLTQPYGCRKCPFRTDCYTFLELHMKAHDEKTKDRPVPVSPPFATPEAKMLSTAAKIPSRAVQPKVLGALDLTTAVKPQVKQPSKISKIPGPGIDRVSGAKITTAVPKTENATDSSKTTREYFRPSASVKYKDVNPMAFIKCFYFCNFCPVKFLSQDNLDEHFVSEHETEGIKTFDCVDCELRFWDLPSLQSHVKLHRLKRIKGHFRCQECGAYSCTSQEFESHHMTEHGDAKPYKCDLCGFECAKSNLFMGHIKRHMKVHVCDVCSRRFAEHCELRRHLLCHGPELPFKCETCGKGFKAKKQSLIHARIHLEVRDYCCPLCDKKYHSKASLLSHKNAKHGNGKSYMCDQCGKCYPTSGHMARHRATHSDEKSFACNTCEKKFKRREHLKCHMRMHTGEKPYVCKDCGKRFKQVCGLSAHQKVHTGEKPYICVNCDKAFTYSSSLKNGACSQCKPRFEKRVKRNVKSKKRKLDDFDSDISASSTHKRKNSSRKRKEKMSDDFDYGSSQSDSDSDGNVTQPFGCDMCDMRFELQEALDAHAVTHGKNEDGMLHSDKDVLDSLNLKSAVTHEKKDGMLHSENNVQ